MTKFRLNLPGAYTLDGDLFVLCGLLGFALIALCIVELFLISKVKA